MKKLFTLLVAGSMLAFLPSCGEDNAEDSNEAESTEYSGGGTEYTAPADNTVEDETIGNGKPAMGDADPDEVGSGKPRMGGGDGGEVGNGKPEMGN